MSKQTTVRGIDDTVAEDCAAIGVATRDDGWIEAEIETIAPVNTTTIELVVRHPSGERLTWFLDKPKIWDESNLFVRLVEAYGYGPGSVEMLEGELLRIQPAEGDAPVDRGRTWGLFDPDDAPPCLFEKSTSQLLADVFIPGVVYGIIANLFLQMIPLPPTAQIVLVLILCGGGWLYSAAVNLLDPQQ